MNVFYALFLAGALAKWVKDRFYLTDEAPAHYVTKFGVDVGTGSWELRVRVSAGDRDSTASDSHPLLLLLYRDQDFDPSVFQCQGRAVSYDLTVPSNGEWSQSFTGTLGEPDSPHI